MADDPVRNEEDLLSLWIQKTKHSPDPEDRKRIFASLWKRDDIQTWQQEKVDRLRQHYEKYLVCSKDIEQQFSESFKNKTQKKLEDHYLSEHPASNQNDMFVHTPVGRAIKNSLFGLEAFSKAFIAYLWVNYFHSIAAGFAAFINGNLSIYQHTRTEILTDEIAMGRELKEDVLYLLSFLNQLKDSGQLELVPFQNLQALREHIEMRCPEMQNVTSAGSPSRIYDNQVKKDLLELDFSRLDIIPVTLGTLLTRLRFKECLRQDKMERDANYTHIKRFLDRAVLSGELHFKQDMIDLYLLQDANKSVVQVAIQSLSNEYLKKNDSFITPIYAAATTAFSRYFEMIYKYLMSSSDGDVPNSDARANQQMQAARESASAKKP